MKICTYNVNSVRARAPLLERWLQKRRADIDILCLQELKVIDQLFPRELFAQFHYHCAPFGQKSYNGVAICSHLQPIAIQYGFGDPQWDEQKRMILAEFPDFTVINLYAPHGDYRGTEKYYYKLQWYEHFYHFLDHHFRPSDPLLIVGDFNVALSDHDVYDPEKLHDSIGTMPEERKALQNLLAWGLTDTFRHLYPDAQQFTWWDYIGGAIWNNAGMRIDYILCTQPLLRFLTAVEIDLWPRRRRTPTPSDHAPVIATFAMDQ